MNHIIDISKQYIRIQFNERNDNIYRVLLKEQNNVNGTNDRRGETFTFLPSHVPIREVGPLFFNT